MYVLSADTEESNSRKNEPPGKAKASRGSRTVSRMWEEVVLTVASIIPALRSLGIVQLFTTARKKKKERFSFP